MATQTRDSGDQALNPPFVTRDSELATGAKRRCGAPPGNKNARIHGFYSPCITEALRRIIKENTSYGGLDRNVMLAFWQFLAVNEMGAAERVKERACARLIKLVRIKYNIARDDSSGIENALERLPHDLPFTPELAEKMGACLKGEAGCSV